MCEFLYSGVLCLFIISLLPLRKVGICDLAMFFFCIKQDFTLFFSWEM